MSDYRKETLVPDTILPEGNFLLLQTDFLLQLRQASQGTPSPPGVTPQTKDRLLWRRDQIFFPGNVQVAVLGLCHDYSLAGHFRIHKTETRAVHILVA